MLESEDESYLTLHQLIVSTFRPNNPRNPVLCVGRMLQGTRSSRSPWVGAGSSGSAIEQDCSASLSFFLCNFWYCCCCFLQASAANFKMETSAVSNILQHSCRLSNSRLRSPVSRYIHILSTPPGMKLAKVRISRSLDSSCGTGVMRTVRAWARREWDLLIRNWCRIWRKWSISRRIMYMTKPLVRSDKRFAETLARTYLRADKPLQREHQICSGSQGLWYCQTLCQKIREHSRILNLDGLSPGYALKPSLVGSDAQDICRDNDQKGCQSENGENDDQ